MESPRIPYYIVQATRTHWDVGFEFILFYFGTDRGEADTALKRGYALQRQDPTVHNARLECHRLRAERALVIGRLMFGLAANTPLTNTVIPLSAFKQRHYFENLNAGGAPFCGGGLLQEPS